MSDKTAKDTVFMTVDITIANEQFVYVDDGFEGRHSVTVEVPFACARSVLDKLSDAVAVAAMQVFKSKKLQQESGEGEQ